MLRRLDTPLAPGARNGFDDRSRCFGAGAPLGTARDAIALCALLVACDGHTEPRSANADPSAELSASASTGEAAVADEQRAPDSADTRPAPSSDEVAQDEGAELTRDDGSPSAGCCDASVPVVIEPDAPFFIPEQDMVEGSNACDGGRCDCSQHSFTIETRQSCEIDVNQDSALPGALPLDAEAFITLGGEDHRVFALDSFGSGRVVAWCDGSTISELSRAFPLYEYLAQNDEPRIASVGYGTFCQGVSPTGSDENESWPSLGLDGRVVDYVGTNLPLEYLSNPEQLAADYDGLIVCAYLNTWTEDFSDVVRSFVMDHGKGLAVVGEYASSEEDIQLLNDYIAGTGLEFRLVSLDWAPTDAAVTLDCVPGIPRRVR